MRAGGAPMKGVARSDGLLLPASIYMYICICICNFYCESYCEGPAHEVAYVMPALAFLSRATTPLQQPHEYGEATRARMPSVYLPHFMQARNF